MRSILALSLFTALCASANAATVHHHRVRHHVVMSRGVMSPGVASSYASAPRSAYAPSGPADPYDDTPSYNDPSKFGGDTALPAN